MVCGGEDILSSCGLIRCGRQPWTWTCDRPAWQRSGGHVVRSVSEIAALPGFLPRLPSPLCPPSRWWPPGPSRTRRYWWVRRGGSGRRRQRRQVPASPACIGSAFVMPSGLQQKPPTLRTARATFQQSGVSDQDRVRPPATAPVGFKGSVTAARLLPDSCPPHGRTGHSLTRSSCSAATAFRRVNLPARG